MNIHKIWNSISNIDLNFGKNISDNKYGAISTINKIEENEYYLVKWKSVSYTMQYSYKTGIYVIKAGELVCDEIYLNPLINGIIFMKKTRKKNCQVEYCYFK